jgi:hypothetical protein
VCVRVSRAESRLSCFITRPDCVRPVTGGTGSSVVCVPHTCVPGPAARPPHGARSQARRTLESEPSLDRTHDRTPRLSLVSLYVLIILNAVTQPRFHVTWSTRLPIDCRGLREGHWEDSRLDCGAYCQLRGAALTSTTTHVTRQSFSRIMDLIGSAAAQRLRKPRY